MYAIIINYIYLRLICFFSLLLLEKKRLNFFVISFKLIYKNQKFSFEKRLYSLDFNVLIPSYYLFERGKKRRRNIFNLVEFFCIVECSLVIYLDHTINHNNKLFSLSFSLIFFFLINYRLVIVILYIQNRFYFFVLFLFFILLLLILLNDHDLSLSRSRSFFHSLVYFLFFYLFHSLF